MFCTNKSHINHGSDAGSYAYFFEEKKLEKLRKLLLYIFTRGGIPAAEVRKTFAAISEELEKEAMTTAEELRKEGMEQGLKQGLIKGEQDILIKQIEWRFGNLSSQEKDHIYSCKNLLKLEGAIRAFAENKSKEDVLKEIY